MVGAISANHVGSIQIFDYPDMALLHTIPAHSSSVLCLDMDPLGRYFASGGVEGVVGLWEFRDCTCVRSFSERIDDQVQHLAFSPDGIYLAVGTLSNIVIFQVYASACV